ncbi:MAG: hypothetical protein WAL83_14055 [Arenicellales bacterium]
MVSNSDYELAARVREECINTAVSAYEDASIRGLCGEGAFEAAISAIRMMNVSSIVDQWLPPVESHHET